MNTQRKVHKDAEDRGRFSGVHNSWDVACKAYKVRAYPWPVSSYFRKVTCKKCLKLRKQPGRLA